MRHVSIAMGICLLAIACAPAEDAAEENGTATGESAESVSGKPAPETFAATAWRATSEDGALFTTYLDEGGTYRDLRNGDPWQSGSWTLAEDPDGRILCFDPDSEDGVRRCWRPGRMHDDTMRLTNESGREIELTRVDYAPPSEGEEADEAA